MKKYRNFKCSTCEEIQRDVPVDDGVTMVDCNCGKQATRMISAPRCFSNSATCEGRSPSC
jgi:hypothetical protein